MKKTTFLTDFVPSDISVMYKCKRVVADVVVDRMETMIPTQLPINDIWN